MHIFGRLLLAIGCLLCSCENDRSHVDRKYAERAPQLQKNIGSKLFDQLSTAKHVLIKDRHGVSVELNGEDLENFKYLVLNDQSYLFEIRKKILFIPTHVITFDSGGKSVDIILSIVSKQIQFNPSYDQEWVILDDDPISESLHAFLSERGVDLT